MFCAVRYSQVSTILQAIEYLSINDQKDHIEAFCSGRDRAFLRRLIDHSIFDSDENCPNLRHTVANVSENYLHPTETLFTILYAFSAGQPSLNLRFCLQGTCAPNSRPKHLILEMRR
jgi:hypothetical protein